MADYEGLVGKFDANSQDISPEGVDLITRTSRNENRFAPILAKGDEPYYEIGVRGLRPSNLIEEGTLNMLGWFGGNHPQFINPVTGENFGWSDKGIFSEYPAVLPEYKTNSDYAGNLRFSKDKIDRARTAVDEVTKKNGYNFLTNNCKHYRNRIIDKSLELENQ